MTTDTLTDRDKALECLPRLHKSRADDRDTWLAVGMALHSVAPDLLEDYDGWSRQSEKYRPGECQRQWRGFKPDKGRTIASLIAWANEDDPSGGNGQHSPRPAPRRIIPIRKDAPDIFAQRKDVPDIRTAAHNAKPKRSYSTFEDAIQALEQMTGGTFEADWTYHNADGGEALRVVRLKTPPEPGKKPKTYRPVHPVAGGWAIGDPDGLLPLYGLAAIQGADAVAVFEGEKCADLGAGIDLVATTSAHGAQSPHKTDWTPLAGKAVTIYPDRDGDGEKYAASVAKILEQLNPPATVEIVDLPGIPEGGDLEQWLEGRDSQEPEVIREALQTLPARAAAPTATVGTGDGEPVLTCMADVKPQEVQWLRPGYWPLGCPTLLVAKPGEGKTYLATDAAARISTGTPWPEGTPCPSGSTILISAEDDPATILRPRLDAHNADVRRVHLLSAVRRADPNGKPLEVLFTLQDVDALESALRTLQDCRLIVIDPIGSFLGARCDAHRDNEVRAVLAPVAQLAAKYMAAVLVIAHRRKATGATADELALGSRAFTGLARAVWHVCRDGQSERRLLLSGKMNVGRPGPGLAFTISGEPVARVCWEREPVNMTADQALAVEAQEGGGQGVREQAKEWLRDLLAAGAVSVKEIEEQAKAAGFQRHTLRRAREEMPIRVFKMPGAMGGPWHWRLTTGGSTEGVQEDVHPL